MPAEPMAEPPMDNGMPMADNGGEEMPPMNDEIPNDSGNPFDTNFDAGVDANEETDPKKYIQQLTGKLSQSLRSYNENLPQPDADLDKYVAGMIVKQAIEGLSPEDTNDILNKIKGDESEETPEQPSQEEMPQEQPMDNAMPDEGGIDMGESVVKENKTKIDEIFNQVMQNKDEDDQMQKPITNISYKKKPFTSPNFK
jgi:hypothetical protein